MATTLHDELAAILRAEGNRWMTTAELAKAVNERGLYEKRDGSQVTAFQVHGRTRNYGDVFERDGSRVRLLAEAPQAAEGLSAPTPQRDGTLLSTSTLASGTTNAALASLAVEAARRVGVVDAPRRPGLYAVHGDAAVWLELGLGHPTDRRPLYVGKAEDSLLTRDLGTHFASGRTGQSTLRRSLAALLAGRLELVPVPRNLSKPAYFANYALDAASDDRLTTWMRERLTLALWTPDVQVVLDAVESEVIANLGPPLNLAKVTTRWSPTVSAARRKMADRARAWRRAAE